MKKLWDLKKGFSNLELEGQRHGIIMGVTLLLLLGPFYTIQTKTDQTFWRGVYQTFFKSNTFNSLVKISLNIKVCIISMRYFLGFNDEISAQFDLGTLSSMYFAQLSHKWNLILQKIQLSLLSTSTAIGKRIIGFFLPISSKKCLDHFSISKEPRTILMKKKDWEAFWSQRLHKEQQILHTNMTIWWLPEDRFEVAQKLVIESMLFAIQNLTWLVTTAKQLKAYEATQSYTHPKKSF